LFIERNSEGVVSASGDGESEFGGYGGGERYPIFVLKAEEGELKTVM